MTVLADPRFNSFEEWANIAIIELPDDFLPLPTSDWREWARESLKTATFLDAQVPDPEPYELWQDWAEEVRRLIT